MYKRIEEFFKLAALGDSKTMKLTPSAEQHGIYSFFEWQIAMEKEMNWIKEHASIVQLNLAPLRKEWPSCCKALEDALETLTTRDN